MVDTFILAWIGFERRLSMPWQEVPVMGERQEFVRLALVR
jgi:hypothetical protein